MKRVERKQSARMSDSRRRFTKTVTAALVAAPVALYSTNAQERPASKESKSPPGPAPTPSPQPSPVAEAYLPVARARFGQYLSAEEFDRVKRDLEGNVRAADRLSAAKLKNSDEPDFVFEA